MSSFDTPMTQRMAALEERITRLSEIVGDLKATEPFVSGAGDPSGVVNAVQGTIYVRTGATPEMWYNTSLVGTPPEGTTWSRFALGGGGGGSAPADAQYLVLALNATLTAERRLDFSARFATVDGGANADFDVDLAVGGHNLLSTYHGDAAAGAVARGDVITGQGVVPKFTRLGLGGIVGSILTRDANDVLWSTYGLVGTAAQTYTFPPASANLVGGTGTVGYVAYWNGTNTITGEAQLFYDAGNNRLGINDATPSYTLDVNGIVGINGSRTIYNAHALDIANFFHTMYFGSGGASLSHTGGSEAMYNTGVGFAALDATTTGNDNTAVGSSALENNTTGVHNTVVGSSAMIGNDNGSYNMAIGSNAMAQNVSGSYNAAIGESALRANTNASYNTAIGQSAGRYISSGADNTGPSYSVYIGYDTRPNADTETNQIVIGSGARGNGSNTTTIGHTSITDCYIRGNVNIEEDHFVGITSGVRIVFDDSNGFINAILGDAAGGDEVRIVDSGGTAVATADSDGNVNMVNLTINRTGAADGSQLIQFNMDRAWKLYTISTGASNALGLKPDTDDKFFYIQSQDRSVNYMSVFARNAGTGYVRLDCQLGFFATPAARLDINDGAIRLAEMSAPSAPAANSVVIYAEDNGAGKTRLMALFSSGAAQQIAIQP